MLRRLAAATTAGLMLAGSILPAAAPPPHPALARGLALMRDGDFEAAVLELDAAARKIESDPSAERHRPWAYVYLGVAYIELEQEAVARGKFREALAREPGLVLLPAEFSAQSIRVFEDVRAAAAAVAAPVREPAAPRPRPGAPTTPPEKKGSKGPLVAVLLGGAAAAGAAVALGGGGGGDSDTTTTTVIAGGSTTLPGPTEPPPTTNPGTPTTTAPGPPTTTVPPTTTPPATTPPTTLGCTYTVNGPTPPNPFLAIGGAGTCSVQTQGGCRWTAGSNRPWISVSGSAAGSGTIQFTLAPNTDAAARSGTVFLAESPSDSCPIQQRGTLSLQESTEAGAAVWISDLDMEGATGQVIVDGSSVSYQARAAVTVATQGGKRVHRVEALVVTAAGRPGRWRFQLPAGAKPESLRVVAGDVAAIAADAVTFRLAGRPGERVVFTFAHR